MFYSLNNSLFNYLFHGYLMRHGFHLDTVLLDTDYRMQWKYIPLQGNSALPTMEK